MICSAPAEHRGIACGPFCGYLWHIIHKVLWEALTTGVAVGDQLEHPSSVELTVLKPPLTVDDGLAEPVNKDGVRHDGRRCKRAHLLRVWWGQYMWLARRR